jgi:pimeloyl-ACP methyl ester carboxylesterase
MGGTPTVLADISAEWLSEVLHTRVTGFTLQVIGAGEGFMGQLARVSLVGDNVPPSVIVKFPTSDPGGQVMGEMMGVWNREHRFYTEVASQIKGIKLARCLHSSVDPYALVLEDLSPARSGDQVAGPTPDQARTAIDVAATLHSAWFDKPELQTLDWMPSLSDPMTATVGALFPIGWPMFLERYQDSLPPRVLAWCETFAPMIETWMQKYFDWPCTLTHGDFRLDNMFFHDDGTISPWLTFERHMMILKELWLHQPSQMFPNISRPVLFMPADSGDVNWTSNKEQAINFALEHLPNGRVHWFRPAHHDLHAQFPDRCAEVLVTHTQNGFFS